MILHALAYLSRNHSSYRKYDGNPHFYKWGEDVTQIRASKAFSVSSVVSLTKKSYEAFKEMHHGRDLLLYSPSIVASSFDLQYVLVNESTNQILLTSPKLYMADIKNTFASPWVFPCGADINAARSARESLMCYCSSQFCAELEPCEPYLRIRETVIKRCPN